MKISHKRFLDIKAAVSAMRGLALRDSEANFDTLLRHCEDAIGYAESVQRDTWMEALVIAEANHYGKTIRSKILQRIDALPPAPPAI